MIDPSIRLRRAIFRDDLLLVQRIVKNHPRLIHNPDHRAESSLHICAKEGLIEIAEYLIEAGHEAEGFSRNNDGDTALIVAAASSHEDIVHLIASHYPLCVSIRNKSGLNALMAAAKSGSDASVTILLRYGADPNAVDEAGNTALHHASAYGSLKALRTLLFAAANPLPQNYYSWTPLSYSSTVQAEVYFKNLLAERARYEKAQGPPASRQLSGVGLIHGGLASNGGLRLVVEDGGSLGCQSGDDVQESPREVVERSQTPILGRSEKMAFIGGQRMRASSGD